MAAITPTDSTIAFTNIGIVPMDTDEKTMAIKFREYMEGGIKEIGSSTQSLSNDDIIKQITQVKKEYRELKESRKPKKYIPPGGWGESDKAWEESLPANKPNPIIKAKKMVTIAKYKELQKPMSWSSCMHPSAKLKKLIYRQTISDGSGHRIFNLSRDAYPKDIPAQWKPGTFDQDLPIPGLETTTNSFRNMLLRHVDQAPIKVEKELKYHPSKSTAERNSKARIAGELHILKQCRDDVKNELNIINEKEAKATAVLERSMKRAAAKATKATKMQLQSFSETVDDDDFTKNNVDVDANADDDAKEEFKEGDVDADAGAK
jgi:hypothetical protein